MNACNEEVMSILLASKVITKVTKNFDLIQVHITVENVSGEYQASISRPVKYSKINGKRIHTFRIQDSYSLICDACSIIKNPNYHYGIDDKDLKKKIRSSVHKEILKKINKLFEENDESESIKFALSKYKNKKLVRRLVEEFCVQQRYSSEELEDIMNAVRVKFVHE